MSQGDHGNLNAHRGFRRSILNPFSFRQRHVAPSPPIFFSDAAWCHMAAFLQKIVGEGRGEGAVLVRRMPGNPPSSGLSATFSPEAEKDFVHATNNDQKATLVIPTLQSWRCSAKRDAEWSADRRRLLLLEHHDRCDRALPRTLISPTAFVHFLSGTIHSISASFG